MKRRFISAFVFLLLAAATIALLAAAGVARAQDEATRKHILHTLGGPFIISRDKVQEELKLSGDQKQKLRETMTGSIQETMKVVQKLEGLTDGEREKEMQSHRRGSGEKFAAFLRETLTADQLQRFRQLQLQHDGPGALGRPEVRQELNITDGQLRQFMGVIQEMQKKIEPLMKEARSGGNPQEIRPNVIKIRKDHEAMLEAILSAAQRKQWKDMLGKPVDVLDD
jgi:hypothetical protein